MGDSFQILCRSKRRFANVTQAVRIIPRELSRVVQAPKPLCMSQIPGCVRKWFAKQNLVPEVGNSVELWNWGNICVCVCGQPG